MRNRSHRYDINRPRSRCSNHKNFHIMMMLTFIKQHLSNIWNSVWVEKSVAYKTKSLWKTYRRVHVFYVGKCIEHINIKLNFVR